MFSSSPATIDCPAALMYSLLARFHIGLPAQLVIVPRPLDRLRRPDVNDDCARLLIWAIPNLMLGPLRGAESKLN